MNKDETETIEILLPRPLIGRLLNITLSKTDYGERYLGLCVVRWPVGEDDLRRIPSLLKRPMAMALHAKPENTESTHHTGGGGDMYQTCPLSRWRDLRVSRAVPARSYIHTQYPLSSIERILVSGIRKSSCAGHSPILWNS
ncbi:hypothetical protein CIHG_07005 [Coccidioides immitis H538.4]|uniref:Uncharacterized protein n=1 Tax=Coccidioides immitis H538.4 TaxID=396776 RepID=A0A0J8RX10_COCIT|nr:hypothetical protein CIHG_07005 [Coccidioides immitis H538.4]